MPVCRLHAGRYDEAESTERWDKAEIDIRGSFHNLSRGSAYCTQDQILAYIYIYITTIMTYTSLRPIVLDFVKT